MRRAPALRAHLSPPGRVCLAGAGGRREEPASRWSNGGESSSRGRVEAVICRVRGALVARRRALSCQVRQQVGGARQAAAGVAAAGRRAGAWWERVEGWVGRASTRFAVRLQQPQQHWTTVGLFEAAIRPPGRFAAACAGRPPRRRPSAGGPAPHIAVSLGTSSRCHHTSVAVVLGYDEENDGADRDAEADRGVCLCPASLMACKTSRHDCRADT